MNLYQIDVQICGTAYIKATSEAEAMTKVAELENGFLTCSSGDLEDHPIFNDRAYDDPDLPDVTLSPAMTIIGVQSGQDAPELVIVLDTEPEASHEG